MSAHGGLSCRPCRRPSLRWTCRCLIQRQRHYRDLHSFPTRRSSDLYLKTSGRKADRVALVVKYAKAQGLYRTSVSPDPDRKSTRLNSSHANISYAVFCLKKKKKKNKPSTLKRVKKKIIQITH